MTKFLLALSLLVSAPTYGHTEINVTDMNLELKRMPHQRDFFIPGQIEWGYEVTLNFTSKWAGLYLESDLTGQTYGSQFRNMWWDFTMGHKLIGPIDLVWDHRSQHTLDMKTLDDFPVRDSFGIRINFTH